MTFGELWKDFVENNPAAARKTAETRACDLWPEVAGCAIAGCTESVEYVRGVLYVRIASSSARHEAFLRREDYRTRINEALGANIVRVLIIK